MGTFDSYCSKIILLGNWKLLHKNASLAQYKDDDIAPEKWEAYESLDDNCKVEVYSPVPNVPGMDTRLSFEQSAVIVKGANKMNGQNFVRYDPSMIVLEEPLDSG